MGAAKAGFLAIQTDKPRMQVLMDQMVEKDGLLRQMANVALDFGSVQQGWSLFLDCYAKFDDLLLEQKEALRQGLEGQVRDAKLAVDKLASRWASTKPSSDSEGMQVITPAEAQKIIDEIGDWKAQVLAQREATNEIQSHCASFGVATPTFEVLDSLEAEVSGYADSWALFTEYSTELSKMTSEDWVAFRKEVSAFAVLLDRWTNRLRTRGVRDSVGDYLAHQIKQNRDLYPSLQLLAADFLLPEHFKAIFSLLGLDGSITLRNVNLGHFLSAAPNMVRKKVEIRALVERAQGEVIIRESVENLKVWADKTEFSLLAQETSSPLGKTSIIREWKELFTQISDQQALVGSLKESPYFGPFATVAKEFEEKFVLLDEVLHALNLIQRKYLYLEPIFSRGALPSEQARFKRIDGEFRAIMREVSDNPLVMAMCNIPDLRATVHGMLEQLDRCQKALNDFLEEKRSKFPRFYFIGQKTRNFLWVPPLSAHALAADGFRCSLLIVSYLASARWLIVSR
jgi:dynein heavy chain 2